MNHILKGTWSNVLALLVFAGVVFWLFPWWMACLQIVFVVFLWSVIADRDVHREEIASKREALWVVGFGLLLLLSRGLLFWYSAHPLGYDTGIYRAEIWESLAMLPEYVSGLFLGLPLVTNVLGVFGLGVDGILYGVHITGVMLMGLLMWSVVRQMFGGKAALVSLFFVVISLIQFEAYEMLLLKQILALPCILLTLWLVDKRSHLVFVPLLFIALLQPLDALFAGIALVVMAFIRAFFGDKELKYFAETLMVFVVLVVGVFALDPVFWQQGIEQFLLALFQPELAEPSLQEGVFLSLEAYGAQAALLFVLGFGAWWKSLREGKVSVFHVYLVLVLVWILAQLFFYQRLLIQLDMALIVFAGWGSVCLWESLFERQSRIWMMGIAAVLMAFPFGYRLVQFSPSLAYEDLERIQQACQSLPEGATLGVTDNSIAPWVRGFCLDQDVFGPGLFGNTWSRDDWGVFWEGADEQAIQILLEDLPRPLYLYSGFDQAPLSERLFEDLGEGMYRVL